MKQRVIFSSSNCCQILDDIIPESEVPDREKAWIDPSKSPLFCVTAYLHVMLFLIISRISSSSKSGGAGVQQSPVEGFGDIVPTFPDL